MPAVLRNITRTISTMKTSMEPAPVSGKSFQLALVQLGGTSPTKSKNLARARTLALKAAQGQDGSGRVDLIVLPECFNSLYGAGKPSTGSKNPEREKGKFNVNEVPWISLEHFDRYAELIEGDAGEGGESTKMLHELAKETKRWLIGGSIPERDNAGKLYNTSRVIHETHVCSLTSLTDDNRTIWNPEGKMIAKYRKMHLFDVDIPGMSRAVSRSRQNHSLNFLCKRWDYFQRVGNSEWRQ